MFFQKDLVGLSRSSYTFDPTTPASATITFGSDITVNKSGLFYVYNETTEELYYEHGRVTTYFTSLISNVLTLDISTFLGTPDSTDELTIFIGSNDITKDADLGVVKTIDQVRPVIPANSWQALADNLTSLAIGTTYYPIYWNSGHRNIDFTIDSFSTSTDITVTAWITGLSTASVTTDPATNEDYMAFSNTLLGASEINETSDSVYSTTTDINPEIILLKVVVATAADGAVNMRYRTY